MLESVSPQGHLSIRERGSSVGGTKITLLISPEREEERGRKEKAQTDTQDGEGGVLHKAISTMVSNIAKSVHA